MSLEPQSRAKRKLIAAARASRRHLPPALPPALILTDPTRLADPFTLAARLPRGFGVVYRHFGAPERHKTARALSKICGRRGLVFLIAADPQLAAAVGADGVHWPFRLTDEAWRWRSRFALQTVSAHSARQLRQAAGLPVDGVLLSTAFASRSASAGQPLGALRLRQLARRSAKPVYALGGITADTAGAVASVAGFAAVEGFLAFAPEPIRT